MSDNNNVLKPPSFVCTEYAIQTAYDIETRFHLQPLTARWLAGRGLTPDNLADFLDPCLGRLHRPIGMADYEKVVVLLADCISNKETIGLFGDYDTDGVSSVALWVLFFRAIGVPFHVRLAHRARGYGLTPEDVRQFAQASIRTVIACDVGSTDHDAARVAREAGITVIIIDHHTIEAPYPDVDALINPMRADCAFPFKGMATVGLSFYIIIGLRSRLERDCRVPPANLPDPKQYLDIVALGTLADVAPLLDNNRILVHQGLQVINARRRSAIRALCEVVHIDPQEEITEKHVVFRMTPKLNAPGRMGDAQMSLRLLTADDYEEAYSCALELARINEQRQQIQERMYEEALEQAKASLDYRWGIVVSGVDWHPGIVGILAAKLAEHFQRPAVAVALQGDIGRGSVRTFGRINIFEVIRKTAPYLVSFGGHAGAVGIEIERKKLGDFAAAFDESLQAYAGLDDQKPLVFVDAIVALHELTSEFVRELRRIAPFGNQNPEPVFLSQNLDVVSVRYPRHTHLSLMLRDPVTSAMRQAIGYNMAKLVKNRMPKRVDVVYIPEKNMQNQENVQLRILHLWASGEEIAAVES